MASCERASGARGVCADCQGPLLRSGVGAIAILLAACALWTLVSRPARQAPPAVMLLNRPSVTQVQAPQPAPWPAVLQSRRAVGTHHHAQTAHGANTFLDPPGHTMPNVMAPRDTALHTVTTQGPAGPVHWWLRALGAGLQAAGAGLVAAWPRARLTGQMEVPAQTEIRRLDFGGTPVDDTPVDLGNPLLDVYRQHSDIYRQHSDEKEDRKLLEKLEREAYCDLERNVRSSLYELEAYGREVLLVPAQTEIRRLDFGGTPVDDTPVDLVPPYTQHP
uniref:Uncharacterized protein n=1 Tax=Eutreptiella gymnastica TaxID=73025 RepID=A0A7S1I3R4_9EUGL|mmetsp:Transcript_127604/g.220673  ORF Transcript_127604/g.220673 Transcript_127604/m.220673 type:complete len:276 (+) Transcript_127604:51-878(+)